MLKNSFLGKYFKFFAIPFGISVGLLSVFLYFSTFEIYPSVINKTNLLFSSFIIFYFSFFTFLKQKYTVFSREFVKTLGLTSLFLLITQIIFKSLNILSETQSIFLFIFFSLNSVFFLFFKKTTGEANDTPSKKYLIIYTALIILGSFLLVYKIDKNDFYNDEFPTTESAANYYYTGNFWKWDWLEFKSGEFTNCAEEDQWCNYTRAELHSFILAQSYKIFGISVFSSRIVSVAFGVFLFLLYVLILNGILKNKKLVALCTLALILSPKIIELLRYARMYALLMPFFFLLHFIVFKFLIRFNENSLTKKQAAFYITSAGILSLVCYHLHSQTLILILPSGLYLLIGLIKQKRKILLSIYLAFISALAFTTYLLWGLITSFESATEFLNFGARINIDYIKLLFGYPLGFIGFCLSTALFLYLLLKTRAKESIAYEYYIFSYLTCFIQLLVLIFLVNRFSHPVYISNLLPLSVFISIFSLNHFSSILAKKRLQVFLTFILVLLLAATFYSKKGILYGNENFYYANYTIAYKKILENYNPDQDAIFMSYSKKFYLRDLPYKNKGFHLFGNKDYSLEGEEAFMRLLHSYKSGYITWDEYSKGDIKTSVREYVQTHFQRLSGDRLDDTRVEVFYFEENMF